LPRCLNLNRTPHANDNNGQPKAVFVGLRKILLQLGILVVGDLLLLSGCATDQNGQRACDHHYDHTHPGIFLFRSASSNFGRNQSRSVVQLGSPRRSPTMRSDMDALPNSAENENARTGLVEHRQRKNSASVTEGKS
jgi:hypothetical protein